MWEDGDRAEVVRRINMALRATLLVLLGLALFLLGVSPKVIPLICGPAYASSASLMWIFVVYQLFYSAFYVIGIFPYISEKPRMTFVAAVAGLAANVGLNILWIPSHGTAGAALAALASMVLMVAVLLGQSLQAGFRLEWRSLVMLGLLLLPALQHRPVLLVAYLALIVLVIATPWILHPDEKQVLLDRLGKSFKFGSDE
jgi:O-antigen/teichoic acid export membrane protein